MRMPEARRAWMEVLQTLRDNRCQAKLLIPSKTINTIAVERKKICNKTGIKQYLPTNPTLQKAPEGKFQSEGVKDTQKDTRNK